MSMTPPFIWWLLWFTGCRPEQRGHSPLSISQFSPPNALRSSSIFPLRGPESKYVGTHNIWTKQTTAAQFYSAFSRDAYVWFTPKWTGDFQLIMSSHPVEGVSRMEAGVCRGSFQLTHVQQLHGGSLHHLGRQSSTRRRATSLREQSLTSELQVSESTSSNCTSARCQSQSGLFLSPYLCWFVLLVF